MKCPHCKDTGVIETGNNDFPCECPAGDTAIFNTCDGEVTGKELKARARRLELARQMGIEPGGYLD